MQLEINFSVDLIHDPLSPVDAFAKPDEAPSPIVFLAEINDTSSTEELVNDTSSTVELIHDNPSPVDLICDTLSPVESNVNLNLTASPVDSLANLNVSTSPVEPYVSLDVTASLAESRVKMNDIPSPTTAESNIGLI